MGEGGRLLSAAVRWVDAGVCVCVCVGMAGEDVEDVEKADSVLRTLNALTKSVVADCNFLALAATPVAPRDVLLAMSSRLGMLIVPISAAADEKDVLIL